MSISKEYAEQLRKSKGGGGSTRSGQGVRVENKSAPPPVQRSQPVIAVGPPTGEGALQFEGSFAEVAAVVGVTERTVRRWVAGESRPSPMALRSLKQEGLL